VLTDIGQQLSDRDAAQAAEKLDAAIAMLAALDSGQILMPLRYRALLARSEDGDEAAVVYFDRALEVCAQRALDHLMCDLLRANRAGVLASMGDGAQALAEVDAAMASMRAKQADQDNEYAQALESRAKAQHALGQRDAALATQTDALERYQALFGDSHEEVDRARRNLEKLR
jgi:hypothetical protein